MVVVLPAPFGPRRPKISFLRMTKETLSTAATPSKRFASPSASSYVSKRFPGGRDRFVRNSRPRHGRCCEWTPAYREFIFRYAVHLGRATPVRLDGRADDKPDRSSALGEAAPEVACVVRDRDDGAAGALGEKGAALVGRSPLPRRDPGPFRKHDDPHAIGETFASLSDQSANRFAPRQPVDGDRTQEREAPPEGGLSRERLLERPSLRCDQCLEGQGLRQH